MENTSRKRPEEQLSRLSSIIDAMVDGIIITDLHGRITYVNNALTEQLGYVKEEMLGKTPATFIVKKDMPKFVAAVKQVRSSKPLPKRSEYLANHKDGREILFSVNFSVLNDREGNPKEIIAVSRDITERKRAEKELKLKDSAIETSINAIALADLAGNLTYVNYSFLKIWEYEEKEVLGKPAVTFWQRGEQAAGIVDALHEKGSWMGELAAVRKDGSVFNVQLSASMVTDEVGNPVCMLASFIDITERKKAEAALRASEERYRKLVELAPDGIITLDLKGRITSCNPAMFRLTGYSKEDWIGKHISQLKTIQKRELPKYLKLFSSFLREKKKSIVEFPYRRKDGTIGWGEAHWGLLEVGGKKIGLQAILRDITERKQTEAALRASEERYRSLFELAPDGIMTANLKGVVTSCNAAALRLTGFSKDELVGKHFTQLGTLRGRDMPKYLKLFSSLVRGKKYVPMEFIFKRKDGTNRLGEAHVSLLEVGGKNVGVQAILRDITARKKAEAELYRINQYLESIIDNASVWLDVLDTQANVMVWNKAAAAISGYSRKEVVGHDKIWEWLYPDEAYRSEVLAKANAIIESGEVDVDDETIIRCKDGQTKTISWYSKNLVDEKDTSIGSIAIGHDITERKKAEKAQQDLEEQRSNFIAITSHELRTPLTSIKGYAEILEQRDATLDHETKLKCWATITRNIKRLERLITGVSTLSQIERGIFYLDVQEMDFKEFLMESLQPYINRLGSQLELQNFHVLNPTRIEADADRLFQALANLLENAIKHTHPDQRKISVIPKIFQHAVQIHITDNGAGIVAEHLERIFDPFVSFSTEYSVRGTGIGLYLSRRIVEEHGGTLIAQSAGCGRGATFVLKLPRKEVD